MTDEHNFIARLTQLVSACGKQTSFAAVARIRPSRLNDYLKGRHHPTEKNILKIARAAHVAPAWLRGEIDDPNPPSDALPSPTVQEDLARIKEPLRGLDGADGPNGVRPGNPQRPLRPPLPFLPRLPPFAPLRPP
ncbi:MAG: helix-turn-helix transcriptional regulator [Pseudomonadota bacterium]